MSMPTDPQQPSYDDSVAGEPLAPPLEPAPIAAPAEPSAMPSASSPTPVPTAQAEESEGGKVKAAALLTGAAALANKVRQEAPKKVKQIREKRVAGRCVIVTEANDATLAIGPYKDEETAQKDLFKVGGTPRVVELVSETAFFRPRESS